METLFYRFIYPLGVALGKLLPLRREKIERWLVGRNNVLVKKYLRQVRGIKKLLLLLPHCLQWNECDRRLAGNILNCAGCGKCDIKNILTLGEKYGIVIKVATGGRLAQRFVREINPDLILAVACERELVEGVSAIWPKRSAVVILDRPNGPCINTRVEIAAIDEWLKFIGAEQ
jgi:hypothetical protein